MRKIGSFFFRRALTTGLLFLHAQLPGSKVQYNDYRIGSGATGQRHAGSVETLFRQPFPKARTMWWPLRKCRLKKSSPRAHWVISGRPCWPWPARATPCRWMRPSSITGHPPSFDSRRQYHPGQGLRTFAFDNLLVVQKVSGRVLQEFLDHTAYKGWLALFGHPACRSRTRRR